MINITKQYLSLPLMMVLKSTSGQEEQEIPQVHYHNNQDLTKCKQTMVQLEETVDTSHLNLTQLGKTHHPHLTCPQIRFQLVLIPVLQFVLQTA